jgi:hypothetical protein
MHHQQQAVLGNNTSDINTLWQFTKIGVVHLLVFGAASILASHITTVGNEVLVAQNPNCGPWDPNFDRESAENQELTVIYESYLKMGLEASREYVMTCIMEPQSLPECNAFKSLQINWTSTNVPFPFHGLCLGPANGSLYMDTGLIDSRDDLGINAQDRDRVQIRRNATCIPITTQGYTMTVKVSRSTGRITLLP